MFSTYAHFPEIFKKKFPGLIKFYCVDLLTFYMFPSVVNLDNIVMINTGIRSYFPHILANNCLFFFDESSSMQREIEFQFSLMCIFLMLMMLNISSNVY